MGIVKKIAGSAGKKAVKAVAKKAVKVLSEEKNIEKATKFINKHTGQEFSNEDVAKTVEKMKSVDVAKIASETNEIFKAQKVLAKLQNGGKITQDILDAIVCDNKEKLEMACREAIRAEAAGKPLRYLSEEEVKSALSLRKAITKSVAHTIATKIS